MEQRTFGILAHIDAGKTTLTERMLFDAGARRVLGNVDDGTATTDWLREEQERGISIAAATAYATWRGCDLQIVDLPGHVDFTAEVERSLDVIDGAVVLVDGVRGVESQTKAAWELADRRQLPRLLFVNKLDRQGADFRATIAMVRERLEARTLPIVVPLLDGRGAFAGLGHAIDGVVHWFGGPADAATQADLASQVRQAHAAVVEFCADLDDGVLADFVGGRSVASGRLWAVLRRGTLAGQVVPALAGSALDNHGVVQLLDAVVALLPGFDERRTEVTAVPLASHGGGFLGQVFKIQHADERVFTHVRGLAGTLQSGDQLRSGPPCEGAFVSPQPARLAGGVLEPRLTVGAGDVFVLVGRLGLRTGCRIGAPGLVLTPSVSGFSEPVVGVEIEPEQATDAGCIRAAIEEQLVDDPTLRLETGGPSGAFVLFGMGELHLAVVVQRVAARSRCSFRVSAPRLSMRGTVRHAGEGRATLRAGRAQELFAEVAVVLAPHPEVEPSIDVRGDAKWVPILRAAVASCLAVGIAHGRPAAFVRVTVTDGRASDGCEALLEQAVQVAIGKAGIAAGACEVEPWVQFEVECPEEFRFGVLADLGARGAALAQVSAGALGARVVGRGSLRSFLGYATRLRSLTQGRGSFHLRPIGLRFADGSTPGSGKSSGQP